MPESMVARCIGRMAAWCRLSIMCIDYEYPNWHLLLSFSIFDLCPSGSARRTHGFDQSFEDEAFARLAKAFNGDAAELKSQYAELLPFATTQYSKYQSKVRYLISTARAPPSQPIGNNHTHTYLLSPPPPKPLSTRLGGRMLGFSRESWPLGCQRSIGQKACALVCLRSSGSACMPCKPGTGSRVQSVSGDLLGSAGRLASIDLRVLTHSSR